MILDIFQKYHDLIEDYEIQKFRMLGNGYEMVIQIHLIQGMILHVRDYLFMDGSRKYSFHWQDNLCQCKVRWDNAPHHQNTNTFPFHKHVGIEE
ncbi:MAG: hypothetical protein HQM11_21385 [SAR324 cluster bacterium]|nr:hypothetical protein [SAR324 cluster bacterium]